MTDVNEGDAHGLLLGAYALNVLDLAETVEIRQHLAGCAPCRTELAELEGVRDMIGQVPEALLLGPPEDSELLLQSTLRQVRMRESVARNRSRLGALVGAAAVLVAAIGGGVLVGRQAGNAADQPAVAAPTTPTAHGQPVSPTAKVVSARDTATGARLTATVEPAAGWVRVNASVTGVPQGERCHLVVIADDGTRQIAGSWVVSATGEQSGTNLDGSAIIDPMRVTAVAVENIEGNAFVTARI